MKVRLFILRTVLGQSNINAIASSFHDEKIESSRQGPSMTLVKIIVQSETCGHPFDVRCSSQGPPSSHVRWSAKAWAHATPRRGMARPQRLGDLSLFRPVFYSRVCARNPRMRGRGGRFPQGRFPGHDKDLTVIPVVWTCLWTHVCCLLRTQGCEVINIKTVSTRYSITQWMPLDIPDCVTSPGFRLNIFCAWSHTLII